jgi:D-alanyl-lipoteichoic acid acyltransferase DltB (MBOAT superfamily)
MAIGAALLFNIKLPINFNSPYKATSIQDFWHRWHITLSRFLRDYLYIPLGGNRKGLLRTNANLFITFLLGGIWHGAGWTFVAWGAMHGTAIVIHRVWQKIGFRIPTLLAWFVTFNFINITWVFFRATNFHHATKVLKGMFAGDVILPSSISNYFESIKDSGITLGYWSKLFAHDIYIGWWLIGAFVVTLFFKNSMQLRASFKPNLYYMTLTVLFSLAIFVLHRKSEFIYFNF